MKFTKEQYIQLGKRFSEKSFLGKIMLIKQNPEIFTLEVSDGNFFLRLEDEAMWESLDSYFSFPQNLEDIEFKQLFSLIDIKVI
jgi:hypothetical protein